VKQQKDKRPDNEILDVASLEKMMDASSTHLVRRPGVGWSESMASLRHGVEMLKQFLKTQGNELKFEELVTMLGDPEVESAIAYIDSSSTVDPDKKVLITAIKKFADLVTTDDNAEELAHAGQQLAIVGGRLYLAGIHLLQLIVAVTQPESISKKMPKNISEEKHVKKWLAKPKDKDVMAKALAALLLEALEKRKAWGDATKNTASSVLGMKSKKRRKSSSSSSPGKASSASSESVQSLLSESVVIFRNKKAAAKDTKKKRKASSASSTTEEKEKKKTTKGKKDTRDKKAKETKENPKGEDTKEKDGEGTKIKGSKKASSTSSSEEADEKKKKKAKTGKMDSGDKKPQKTEGAEDDDMKEKKETETKDDKDEAQEADSDASI
jgi:hypothetical protein